MVLAFKIIIFVAMVLNLIGMIYHDVQMSKLNGRNKSINRVRYGFDILIIIVCILSIIFLFKVI